MRPSTVTDNHFKPLLDCVGLPRSVRFHDLRHTAATLLLGRGVHPKLVQELLGHSSIAITLDRYSHWIPSMGDRQPPRWKPRCPDSKAFGLVSNWCQ
jgi:integrase